MKEEIMNAFKRLIKLMPGAIYLKDTYGYYLSCSDYLLKESNFKDASDVIGKTDYDLFPKDLADRLRDNDLTVIETGRELIVEESIMLPDGKSRKFFQAIKIPLKDDNGMIIGILGNSVDITDRKKSESLKIESELQKIKLKEQENFRKIVNQAAEDIQTPLAILLILVQRCAGLTKKEVFETIEKLAVDAPISLYWLDENSVLLGANERDMESIGGKSVADFVGKTPYDYLPFEAADSKVKHNNLVMQTGKILSKEDIVNDFTTGEIKYFIAFKAPLYDKDGKSIGILCASTDITAEKNAERLKLETELQKAKLKEQEQFRKVADQVVHDIRSPLASLLMMVKSCESYLPEQARITLREAATSIGDIANNLLCKYKEGNSIVSTVEKNQPTMLSLTLLQLLSEKKHQYKELPVKFNHNFCPDCNFAFINVEPIAFKRMMSNLINNAVDALGGAEGTVSLKLDMDGKQAKITVKDNGKGIPQEVIDKIINNIAITSGKKEGHGIGFTQIRDTLERNQGKLAISSQMGKGTEIILTFPIVATPNWVAKDIKLNKRDIVVVLDDDDSIHGAWDMRFKDYKKNIGLKHFTSGQEAIDFINNFPENEKIFLLADFELLKQELNGLHVIEKTGIKRSVLVTSHYSNQVILDLAVKSGTKVLPKPLASEVPIEIQGGSKNKKHECIGPHGYDDVKRTNKNESRSNRITKGSAASKHATNEFKKVDLVLIDDSELFADSLASLIEMHGKTVDKYYSPVKFLDKVSQYAKDTMIFMDNDFGTHLNGIELAKQLYDMGYTKLYLLSGNDFEKAEVPNYLTVVSKIDMNKLLSFIA